jgi:hypothetical protein
MVVSSAHQNAPIAHYTRASLAELAARYGLTIVERAYVLRSELIVAMRKGGSVAIAPQPL